MTMTVEEFDLWMETSDGGSSLYEYLYDNYPELGKHGLMNACESGDYVEDFMDYLIKEGVVVE